MTRPDVLQAGERADLTGLGRPELAALPDHLDTEHGMLAGLSPADREQLAELLRRFLVALGRVPSAE